MPVEADTLKQLMQLDDHVTPHKRHNMDPGLPPEKEYKYPYALHDWLQGRFQHYITSMQLSSSAESGWAHHLHWMGNN